MRKTPVLQKERKIVPHSPIGSIPRTLPKTVPPMTTVALHAKNTIIIMGGMATLHITATSLGRTNVAHANTMDMMSTIVLKVSLQTQNKKGTQIILGTTIHPSAEYRC